MSGFGSMCVCIRVVAMVMSVVARLRVMVVLGSAELKARSGPRKVVAWALFWMA